MQFTKSALVLATMAASAMAAATTSLNSSLTSTTSIKVSSGCSFKTYTATAQSNLDELASCDAVKGTIYITGSGLGSASIASVKAIYGDLIINNATHLTSFAADSLTTITGELELTELTILSSLSFGSLSSVGSINWVTLPALTNTGLSSVTDSQTVIISDTELENLDGLDATNVETFNINNNKNLNTIDSQLQTVSSALEVSFNAEDVEISFDKLVWANNITFRDVSSISLSSLEVVNASFGLIDNEVDSVELPQLTKVGGTLSIVENDSLKSANFSELASIGGGFVIANNTKLSDIDGFDSLKTIGGAVILTGDFDKADLPSLTSVKGGFDVESTGELDCSDFESLDKKGKIQGDKFVCKAASHSTSISQSASETETDSTSTGSATESGSSSSSSSSSSKGAAAGAYDGVKATSIFGTFAAVALALL